MDDLEDAGGWMEPRPDLLPQPVKLQDPPKFRSLHRRNFSRAIHAHAALEQFQLEVAGLRGRLVQFMKLLEVQSSTPVTEQVSRDPMMQVLASQDTQDPKFSESAVLGSLVDAMKLPDKQPVLSVNAVMGRIASLNRRIARLNTIVKFARKQLNAETIPTEILPSRHIFTSTYRRLDGVPLAQLMEIQKEYSELAHDLNNRLTAAMGNAQLMQVAKDLDKLKERLACVQAALEQADNEIHAALDKRELSNQNIAQALQTLNSTKDTLSARISMEIDAQVDANNLGSAFGMAPSHFSRLIFDLTDNAQKAGAKNMKVSVRVVQGELVVSLKDDGPGFKGKKPLQASQDSKAVSASNGNGLPICYGFCKKAGGRLHLEDENDATGAEWTIRLPLLKGRR